jgi:hypothetical protein
MNAHQLAPELALETDLERAAADWIRPYDQAWHLMRARDWLVQLEPAATVEMRVAAMTHDIERMFPGGPSLNLAATPWDDPFYLFAHSSRSAECVGVWLQSQQSEGIDEYTIRCLVARHEVGGPRGADAVQAGDSLSYLETLAELTAHWVRSGSCSRAKGIAKLQYMADRIRLPAATAIAAHLLERAIDLLPAAADRPADDEPVPGGRGDTNSRGEMD